MEKEPKPQEKYNIMGKELTFKDKEEIDLAIKTEKTMITGLMEDETEKTSEQLRIIEKVNEHLNEELQDMGIKKEFSLSSNKIHFLPGDVYKKQFSGKTEAGFTNVIDNEIFVDLSQAINNKKLYSIILHESIHLVSAERYAAEKNKMQISVWLGKSGYENIKDPIGLHEHLRGFNEVVVTKVSQGIFKKHKKELTKELRLSKKEKKAGAHGYRTEILDLIISEIARENNEKEKDVWNRFKKGLFTGEMMHLRDIERTFGRGSLRVIAALYSSTKKEINSEEAYDKIIDYLVTNNEKRKEEIAKEILIDREWVAYKKQRSKL